MKLIEFVNAINKLVDAGHGNDVVVFAIDEEGNAFLPVVFGPTCGHYQHSNYSRDWKDTLNEDDDPEQFVPAVCIN